MLVVCTSAIMVSTKASVCRWPPSHADQIQSPSPSPFAVKQARSHNPTGQRGQVSPSSKAQLWWAQTAPPRQQPEDGVLVISKLWKTSILLVCWYLDCFPLEKLDSTGLFCNWKQTKSDVTANCREKWESLLFSSKTLCWRCSLVKHNVMTQANYSLFFFFFPRKRCGEIG